MQGFHLKQFPVVIRYGLPITAMGLVIFLSNLLVHYPVAVVFGSVDLAEWLTWGAFTYPVAFLITDSTNRLFGPGHARQLVYVGFALGVLLTLTDALVTAAAQYQQGNGGSGELKETQCVPEPIPASACRRLGHR